MLFSSKTKGFFFEQNDHAILLARTSAAEPPFVIEELRQCPVGDRAALTDAIKQLQPKRSPSGYLNAYCGVYPFNRLVRRATLELKRVKEPEYFSELLATQFRIEPEKYTVHAINAPDGTDFDLAKPTQKEALLCGLMTSEIDAIQDKLVASGIYPDRLELASVAMLGGIVDYLSFKESKVSTLILEIGAESTHSFIVSAAGVEASRPIPQGLDSMVPVVQKELGLKDEESARKLFFSNTFDFTGMGPVLTKKLLKELQSSIGFYEVQTGQSVGQALCVLLPPRLAWLDVSISNALGVTGLTLDLVPWLESRQITLSSKVAAEGIDARWFGLLSLMARSTPNQKPDVAPAEKKD